MVSTIFFIFYFFFVFLFSYLFPLWYLYPFYLIFSLILSFLVVLIITYIHSFFFKKSKITNNYKHYYTRSLCYFVINFGLRVKVHLTGYEKVDKKNIACFYPNHKSLPDPLYLLSVFDIRLATTPKQGVFRAWFIGKWLESLGSVEIDRTSIKNTVKSLQKGSEIAKQGINFIIFPEAGIKSMETPLMMEAHGGAYKIAYDSKATVYPVSMLNTLLVKKLAPLKVADVYIRILEPIKFDDYKNIKSNELAEKVMNIVNQDIKEQTEILGGKL